MLAYAGMPEPCTEESAVVALVRSCGKHSDGLELSMANELPHWLKYAITGDLRFRNHYTARACGETACRSHAA